MGDASTFDNYMPNGGEYTDPTTVYGYGWRIDYISSTFLDGWINYVKPVRAFAISRYTSADTLAERVAAFHADKSMHTKIGALDDNVIMICAEETPRGDGQGYWFFWWDNDVSDCCIGRFLTTDSEADVAAHFETYVCEMAREGCGEGTGVFPLDVSAFRGWVSF